MSDPYDVLGVDRAANGDEIRRAYQLRVQECASEHDGVRRYQEVQRAYAVLGDAGRRAAYDAAVLAPAQPGLETVEPLPQDAVAEGFERPWSSQTLPPALPERPLAVTRHHSRNPVDRLFGNLPRGWRIALDWVVTIVGAIAIVLAIKAWVINPYRIPSSSMEPTLHCATPGSGCEAGFSDRVLANRFIYHFRDPERGDIIVFNTPPAAALKCGAGGTFVKRLIGLPGETFSERRGYVYINGHRLVEPYIQSARRDSRTVPPRHIPPSNYFFMGDNRVQSCDSRDWGTVPRKNLIGQVFAVYWPPNRISFR